MNVSFVTSALQTTQLSPVAVSTIKTDWLLTCQILLRAVWSVYMAD